jgi:2,3-bisphosphoglycerate-independent phosphoglycerate mutase
MHILMVFLDGVGLGDDNPEINPFVAAELPTLHSLTNGHLWLHTTGRQTSERANFVPTDPCLGVSGRPQSATGQAAILTGRNVPQIIGEHYGPKPNPAIRQILSEDNFFKQVVSHGKTAALVEAYPPGWHKGINSGKRLPSSYQQAAREAGLAFMTESDLRAGRALSGDWTGRGWRTQLGFDDTPILTPEEAGVRLVEISRQYDFAFFAHWLTDVIGHRGPLNAGIELLETFDGVMSGILEAWDDQEGLVIVTSDHGNIEDIGDRKHTTNNVPTVIIGAEKAAFADGFADLTDFVPRMTRLLLAK